MQAVQKVDLIGVDDYLAGEQLSEMKHELIHGVVYAMVGASLHHARLCRNLPVADICHWVRRVSVTAAGV